MKFVHRADDGTEQDVTEDVACLYDLVVNSMDWGSGFLTVEDARPVVRIAKLGGFKDWEQAQKYVDDQAHSAEQSRFLATQPNAFYARRSHIPRHSAAYGLFSGMSVAGLLGVDQALKDHPEQDPDYIVHDHVYSSVGRCMWRGCFAVKETP